MLRPLLTLSVGVLPSDTTVGWDLDGDGDTDDAATPTVQWTVPGDAVAGAPLTVTAVANGPDAHDVAYEVIVVAPGGNLPPVVPVVAGANLITVAPGATANLSVSATDPNGDALQYRWYVEGVEVPGATAATHAFAAPVCSSGCHRQPAPDTGLRRQKSGLQATGYALAAPRPANPQDICPSRHKPDCRPDCAPCDAGTHWRETRKSHRGRSA